MGTLHSRALEVLESVGQGTNPDCLKCHTTGYGDDGGFVDRATTNSLAGVTCEACHGAQSQHAMNASDVSLRPIVSISAAVCGQCHTGEHQPNYDDWLMSKHADSIEPSHLTNWQTGGASSNLTTCGVCHSGDYFFHKVILKESVTDFATDTIPKGKPVDGNLLQGVPSDQMRRVTCAICHNPHARTGNSANDSGDGRDYQLRYPEIKYASPTTSLAAVQDPTRFNLCGQCHHTRDRTWADSSREPHPSDQTNVFFGEIPAPNPPKSQIPIVPPRVSVHLNAPKQCATCHVARRIEEGGIAPSVSGHTFEVNFLGCTQCHGTIDIAMSKLAGLKGELDIRLADVLNALAAWAARPGNSAWCASVTPAGGTCWQFTSDGGPNASNQNKIPDDIKKARYLYYYIKEGGGAGGVHNPDFARDCLVTAKNYALNAPDHLP
jgi:hypothetical protein